MAKISLTICFGSDEYGQSNTPDNLKDEVQYLSAGGHTSCAIKSES